MKYTLHNEDCLKQLKTMKDNSIDAIVTDPPYELGFMNKKWDSTGIAYNVELWKEALRVLKPGGHLLAFSSSRTYHRMAASIEDAGFEIRDMIHWTYGSGFPKSYDIAKGITAKELTGGSSPKNLRKARLKENYEPTGQEDYAKGRMFSSDIESDTVETELTDKAKKWNGWGTALKPSHEPIVLARKPISEKTVAENVLKWGTGGINIDKCRVGNETIKTNGKYNTCEESFRNGRFPANTIIDENISKVLDEQSGIKQRNGHWSKTKTTGYGEFGNGKSEYLGVGEKDNDICGASRYFINIEQDADIDDLTPFYYCPKASTKERGECNNHPTVKPIKLMRYLINLITPPGGTVLDIFMGSGTTGVACIEEDVNFIGIELDKQYFDISQERINKIKEDKQDE